jgi:hypothetical protein
MNTPSCIIRSAQLTLFSGFALFGQSIDHPDPAIQKMLGEISEERIAADMQRLGAFETRGNFSATTSTERGIGAARQWIFDQFKSYSPRLEVSFDRYRVKKQGARILRDLDLVNVVAVLPGTTQADNRLIVSAHYDSLNLVRKTGVAAVNPDGSERPTDDVFDFEKSIDAPAPGVTDDASGVALVLELARVMSQYKFEKTLVFVTFAGEELGLVGSTLYASKARAEGQRIEAVLNNDIIGVAVAGDGHAENGLVHVFSEEPADSSSRQLARYIRETAQLYVPAFQASLVFRQDRFNRGGDHSPFNASGFAAVRFTAAAENLEIQHTPNDTFDKSSPSYTANVARVNGAALASLALAPPTPETNREITSGAAKGRKTPAIARGKSHYDAVLRWEGVPVDDLTGYAVVLRSTTVPFWEHQIFVGKTNEYTLPGVSIDDVVIGIKAIDNEGHESLVSAYVASPYAVRSYETVPTTKQ